MSPAGSFIIANFMTDEGLKLLHVNPLTAKPGDVKPPPGSTATSATASSSENPNHNRNDSSTSSATPSTTAPAAPAAAAAASSAAGAAGDSQQGEKSAEAPAAAGQSEAKKLPADDGIQKIGLLSQFKWGCPDNVEEVCCWTMLCPMTHMSHIAAARWHTVQHYSTLLAESSRYGMCSSTKCCSKDSCGRQGVAV
jgi:hypothetical protein